MMDAKPLLVEILDAVVVGKAAQALLRSRENQVMEANRSPDKGVLDNSTSNGVSALSRNAENLDPPTTPPTRYLT
jgi:hypothetical protein